MKVFFVLRELSAAGAPKSIAWVANQLAESGFEVHFTTIFSDKREQVLSEKIKFHNLKIHQSRFRLIRNTKVLYEVIRSLKMLIKNISPDIVVMTPNAIGTGFIILNMFRKYKIVVTERNDPSVRKGIRGYLRNRVVCLADGAVFQLDEVKNMYNNNVRRKSVVIPNPAFISKQKQISRIGYKKRANTIVSVGRFSIKHKRQDIMLKAFEKILETHPDMELIFYGDGPDIGKIKQMAIDMGIKSKVKLAGWVSNIAEHIKNAKVFVLTSDFEGIPNALIEAMYMGIPCVATDCSPGGAKFIIKDGINGFLVSRRNIEKIAEKVSILINDSDISDNMGKNAQEIVNTLSEERISSMWINYLSSLKNS